MIVSWLLSRCCCRLFGDGPLPFQPLVELFDGKPAVVILILLGRIEEEDDGMDGASALDQPRRGPFGMRSEERRVGKECVSRCRSRWSRYLKKKNKRKIT